MTKWQAVRFDWDERTNSYLAWLGYKAATGQNAVEAFTQLALALGPLVLDRDYDTLTLLIEQETLSNARQVSQ